MKIKKDIINVGLIGAGKWGLNYIKTINSLPFFHLKLVYTSNQSIKKIIKSNCNITSDIGLFFNRDEFDGIIIATPPSTQVNLALRFIKIGMPLLLEKPLCTSLKDADLILKLANKFKSLILINNIFLYNEAFKAFKNTLEKRNDFKYFYAIDGNKGPYREYMSPFWDWGTHSLSMCLALMGYPVRGQLEEFKNDGNGNNYKIKLEFLKGRNGILIFGNAMKEKKRYFQAEFGKKKCNLVYNELAEKKVYRKDCSNNFKYYNYKSTEPLISVLNEFSKKILHNDLNNQSLRFNRDIVNILERLILHKSVEFTFY